MVTGQEREEDLGGEEGGKTAVGMKRKKNSKRSTPSAPSKEIRSLFPHRNVSVAVRMTGVTQAPCLSDLAV